VIKVMLVDDHPIVLAGLSALVESDGGLALVAAARSTAEALAVSAEPDIAVLDLQLPDGDGISLGRALKRRWPRLRVIVFTMHADDQSVIRSLGSGLDGYLLKDSDPDDVLAAIHSTAHGALVLGRGAQAAVVAAAAATPHPGALDALDSRDLEILDLLARGLTTAQVAARLFLAPKTIRNRISEMLGKLGVATREEAVALGRAAGLGTPAGGSRQPAG
jgi:DNA-binding NarL/FixJ family response regulator